MLYTQKYESPAGTYIIKADNEYLYELKFCREIYAEPDNTNHITNMAAEWLDAYFAGKKPDIHSLPLNPQGNDFRLRVWNILTKIPYGETVTYGDIAKIIAEERGIERMSAQAIGNAVGHNPIPIIIPCHRVMGAGGKITGYANGIETKQLLLDFESKTI